MSEAPKFGTSGLRGLVTDLTDELVMRYVAAFMRACETGGRVFVGEDLRASSPRIAAAVAAAVQSEGGEAVLCGQVPTPALALAAQAVGAAAVMVTGSHIPDDRNGLKFYTPAGEITKQDEEAIGAALRAAAPPAAAPATAREAGAGVLAAYRDRYLRAFAAPGSETPLSGLKLGLYQHSTVVRDLAAELLQALGAEVVPLARSDRFIPVDTEAVPAALRTDLRRWAADIGTDAIVSADGDADRPLLTDAAGTVIPGDLLGLLAARHLGADTVVTPVSSTTALERSGAFARVRRTRIGSPFVIAGIAAERAADPAARVLGFEANGGLLLGFESELPGGRLAPLVTRDALLPILAVLAAARSAGGVAALCAGLPLRATAADRLQRIDRDRAAALLDRLAVDPAARQALFGEPGAAPDLTDGLRVDLTGDRIVHLRLSGNAPELRCYAEADRPDRAEALVADTLDRLIRHEDGRLQSPDPA